MILIWLIIVYGCYRGYKYARKKGMSNGNIIFTAIAGVFVFILGLIKISNHNTKQHEIVLLCINVLLVEEKLEHTSQFHQHQ